MPLSAPHEAISVEVKWRAGGCWADVEYAGASLEEMRAAGCIDAYTLDIFSRTRQRITSSELGTCKRSRWYGKPAGWRIVWTVKRENFHRLPGCSSARMSQPRADGERVRSVGRHQRSVRWTVIERKLIVVDWDALRVRPMEGTAA